MSVNSVSQANNSATNCIEKAATTCSSFFSTITQTAVATFKSVVSPTVKPKTFDDALKEANKGSKTLLNELDQYHLSDEQESLVVEALFKESPTAYRDQKNKKTAKNSLCLKIVKKAIEDEQTYILHNLNKYNLTETQKHEFSQQFTKIFPDLVGSHIDKLGLTPEQEKEIAHLLVKQPAANISADIENFTHLTVEEKKDIALKAAAFDPTKVYENLAKYDFTDTSFIKDKLQLYYDFETLLSQLENDDPNALENVLKGAQRITERAPLPEKFLQKLTLSLSSKLNGATQQEAIDLIHLINQHPSAVTYTLVNSVHEMVRPLFPTLPQYCCVNHEGTKLKGKGFDWLVHTQGLPEGVKIYDTVYVKEVKSHIQAFMEEDTLKKAVIPLNFDEQLSSHFNPLYLEKTENGQLRAFISDSTGEFGERPFPQQVMDELTGLPIKDIYVLNPQRQFSTAVCSMFTLSDLLEIVKQRDLFALLDKEGDIQEVTTGTTTYKKVNTPPAGWMKMHQSMTKVKSYIATKGNRLIEASSCSLFQHGEGKLQDLVDRVSYYTYDRQGISKKQNKRAELAMSLAFEELLIHVREAPSI